MPRKSKLKGGGVNQLPQEPDNTNMIFLLIGICIFILPIAGGIAYFFVYLNSCKDKDENGDPVVVCLPGTTIKNESCKDNVCNQDNCCKEKTCLPPINLPSGYKLNTEIIGSLSTMTLDSIKGFANGRKDLKESGVECDESSNYKGSPIASTCGGNVNWTLSGCSKNNACIDGENPHASLSNPGNRPRQEFTDKESCSNKSEELEHASVGMMLSSWDDGPNHAKCDSVYHKISENKSVFCKLDASGRDTCVDTTTTCIPP